MDDIDSLNENKIDEFVELAEKDFDAAKDVFLSENFLEEYDIIEPKLCKLYTRLKMDARKEAAMDNFLIAMQRKQPVKLVTAKQNVELKIRHFEDKRIRYRFPFKADGFGPLDVKLSVKNDAKWIEIIPPVISMASVINGQAIDAVCIIDTRLIGSKVAKAIVEVSADTYSYEIEIEVKRSKLITASLSKKCFNFIDAGKVIIDNDFGEDIMVEVLCISDWIIFNSKKYFISKYAEIPFKIKHGKPIGFNKVPVYKAKIIVRAVMKSEVIKEEVEVVIVDSNFTI